MTSFPAWFDAREVVVALLAGVFAAWFALQLVPHRPRLARRVRPYARAALLRLGRNPDVVAERAPEPLLSRSTLTALFAPLVGLVGRAVARRDGSADERLAKLLKQARLYPSLSTDDGLVEFRFRQVLRAVVGSGAGLVIGLLAMSTDGNPGLVLATTVAAGGATTLSLRAGVDKAVEARRSRMRIELFTVNQMLAMDFRIGTGVPQALARLARRSDGEVVAEIREVLTANRAGEPLQNALLNAAEATPEPHAARLFRALERIERRGADARPTQILLQLAADVRNERRDDLQRRAAKARFAQILPIVAFIAPVMVLFLAAPIPSMVLGGLGAN